jgi:hypothetical protein
MSVAATRIGDHLLLLPKITDMTFNMTFHSTLVLTRSAVRIRTDVAPTRAVRKVAPRSPRRFGNERRRIILRGGFRQIERRKVAAPIQYYRTRFDRAQCPSGGYPEALSPSLTPVAILECSSKRIAIRLFSLIIVATRVKGGVSGATGLATSVGGGAGAAAAGGGRRDAERDQQRTATSGEIHIGRSAY